MRELRRRLLATLRRDDQQPRKHFDPVRLAAMGESLLAIGLQIPIVVVGDTVIDGEMRMRAALLVGLKELDAIELDSRPSDDELLVIQASIDFHRSNWKPTERASAIIRLQRKRGCSLVDVCKLLNISQSFGSKLVSCSNLLPKIQALLDAGELDLEKAYIISQQVDPAKQLALADQAKDLTRDQMRQKANVDNDQPVELKASKARFALANGVMVTIEGRRMTLADTITALQDVVKELRQGQRQQLDISTAQRVMRDKAKASSPPKAP